MLQISVLVVVAVIDYTGILSQLRAKLRDRAVRPVRAGCYFQAALSLTDSKTRYILVLREFQEECEEYDDHEFERSARIRDPA